jgi:hypothetical protein
MSVNVAPVFVPVFFFRKVCLNLAVKVVMFQLQ